MSSRLAAAVFALVASVCVAQEPQWPPPASVEARMHELQAVLSARDSTAAEREAAREELANLLKSPAGQARGRTPGEKPPRAAIEPFPRIVRPAENPSVSAPGVAHVDVVTPPKPIVSPQSGAVATPSGRFAIDPRSGSVLHEVPGGYVDPKSGQFVPR
jgi:hypothetical protein